MKKLTAIRVEKASYKPIHSKGGKNPGALLGNRIPDPEYPGLYLHISPHGAKSWRYDFRWPPSASGRRQCLTYGRFPLLGLAEARDKHREARRDIADGINPAERKQEHKRQLHEDAGNTFERIGRAWYETESRGKSDSWKDNNTRWLKWLMDDFGSKSIAAVTDKDILRVTSAVVERGFASSAESIRQLAGKVFAYAAKKRLFSGTNPAQELKGEIRVPRTKNNPHIKENEIPEFVKAVDGSSAEEKTKIATKLLLLCFVRKQELLAAKWPELDLQGAIWEVPAFRMKGGVAHLVPLSSQVVAHFKRMLELFPSGDYVFPSTTRPGEHMGLSTLNVFFDRIGFGKRLTPHGLRSVASTKLNGTRKFGGDVIERQLAHAEKNKIRGSYNKADHLEERKEMMQWWADFIERLCSGESDNVVQLAAKVA